MTSKVDERLLVHPKDRAAWRAWLEENHRVSGAIWLVYDKKASGRTRLDYAHAVEEALCFGWIDSVLNPIDEHRYKQLFSPRKPTSEWSALNKRRVEKLIAEGLMTEAGLAVIRVAKKNGTWSKLDHVEAFVVPDDLARALSASAKAKKFFDTCAPSVRKAFLHRINSAKRPETRAFRVAEVVEGCALGLGGRAWYEWRNARAKARK